MSAPKESGLELNEADRLLPMNNITRIIRHSLPPGCKISSEVKEKMLEATSEFIGFLTNHSVEAYMLEAKRKTLLKDDLINSLNDLDLNIFIPPLNAYLKNKKTKTKRRTSMSTINRNNNTNNNHNDNNKNQIDDQQQA